MDEELFLKFRGFIRQHTGISMRAGKHIMLASRLNKRLRHHRLSSFAEYFSLLCSAQDGGAEMTEFINCVTTNKTAFFRESHHFDFLAETVVPEVARRTRPGETRSLRVWSAACSTGEEAYSIAMTLQQAVRAGWSIAIDASDIDTAVLETARRAVYPVEAIEGLDVELRRRCFLRGKGDMQGMVQIKPELKRNVTFQRINLMDTLWPVEAGLDVIFFRNALIYFDLEMQERFLRRMVQMLRPDGYLVLGHSEHVPWLYDAVRPLSKTIYQRM